MRAFILKRIFFHHAKKTWLPEAMVEQAVLRNWETTLSYFIILKTFYSNNTFYDFSYRSIANKTGLSHATLQRHIKKMVSLNLVRIHNGNLTLIGSEKLKDIYGGRLIPIGFADTKQKTILNIRFSRILSNLEQQHYIAKRKKEIKNLQRTQYLELKKAKSLIKVRGKLNNEISINDYYMLSNKKFGSINNRSRTTGIKIQQMLNDAGYIISKANIERYSDQKFDRRSFYELCLPSCYRLGSRGYIYRILPNKIEIPPSKELSTHIETITI